MSKALRCCASPGRTGRPLALLLALCACGPATLHGRAQRDVPWFRQAGPAGCARAAAASLASYYGQPLSEAARGLLGAEEASDGSVSAGTLKRALESSGYVVSVFSGTWGAGPESVLEPLRTGRPLLVLLGRGVGHFIVLTGFDGERGTISVVDPLRGPLNMERGEFERQWARARRVTLLAIPPAVPPGGSR